MYVAELRANGRYIAAMASTTFEATASVFGLAAANAEDAVWQSLTVRRVHRTLPTACRGAIRLTFSIDQGVDGMLSCEARVSPSSYGVELHEVDTEWWLNAWMHETPFGVFGLEQLVVEAPLEPETP